MKIGFDAKRYYHNRTGLGNYSRTVVGGLQRLFPENDYVLYDTKSFQRTFRLGGVAMADGCDVFHGLSNEIPFDFDSARSGRHGGRMPRSLVTMHDVAWRTFPDMYHWFDRRIYDFKYGSSCRRADRVIAISESTKRDVMRFYGVPEERIDVIYQPVQEYYYSQLPKSEVRRLIREYFGEDGLPVKAGGGYDFLLYVGSLNARKNLMGVLKALTMMEEDNRPFLLIVGNGREYRRECEVFIARNSLERYTRIETNIHNNRLLQALYAEARAFVYPSFYEGFGLPVVEAALQQTPVITTTVSSLPEAAGPDACLIDPHSATASEEMAMLIDRLCSDDAYATEVGTKMEAYARRMFEPDKLMRQMMGCYEF